jgi:isoleucyl-tRNA synthetase
VTGDRGHLSDRWLLGRLDETVAAVRSAWDAYDVTTGTRAIGQFVVDDLSNWWVRLNRPRLWNPGGDADPAALATLHEALTTAARLLAPAAPFLPDHVHRALSGSSVHLAAFPGDQGRAEPKLARAMDAVRRLASLARGAREAVAIKVRQPLPRLVAAIPGDVDRALFEALTPLLLAEVNVKRVEVVTRGTDLVTLDAKPNFRALGKRFGKDTPAVAAAIVALPGAEVARYEAGEQVEVTVNGARHALEPGDLTVQRQAKGDLVVESDGVVLAALDPALDEPLRQEGLARELVSRVQRLRKDLGLHVADRIELRVGGAPALRQAVEGHRSYISGETLAPTVTWDDAPANATELDLDGVPALVAVRRTN